MRTRQEIQADIRQAKEALAKWREDPKTIAQKKEIQRRESMLEGERQAFRAKVDKLFDELKEHDS